MTGLQQSVRSLRQAFRHFPVTFDYTDVSIQQAYMFAYFPHYTQLLEYVLNQAGNDIQGNPPQDLLLFGSGPCPEIIGYLKYLNNRYPNQNFELNVSIFDIASTHWQYSRDITYNQIIPSIRNGHNIQNWNSKDFRFDVDLGKVTLSTSPKLVVYQNCLNEVNTSTYGTIRANFIKLFSNMPSGSLLAIIDFSEYPNVIELIQSIQNDLSEKNGFVLLRDIDNGVIEMRSNYRYPTPIIKENLLTGIPFEIQNGLIPRSKVKFTYSLIEKE